MVIVKLQGGLGNQMFQYAAARAVAPTRKCYFDLSFLNTNNISNSEFTARRFELSLFPNLNFKFLNTFLTKLISRGNEYKVYSLLRNLLLHGFAAIHNCNSYENYSSARTLYLDGYFQNEQCFKHIRNMLLHEFQFPALTNMAANWLQAISNSTNAVSIHVRRGDYMKPAVLAYHGVLPLTYYQEAIAVTSERIRAAEFFVFSDDINWCRENLTLENKKVNFVTPCGAAWEEMALMSKCRHHIIANSSFSWWGAWLSTGDNKLVVAPERWFADQQMNDENRSLIPADWIKV